MPFVSTLWMDYIMRFKWILRKPKVAFSHILTAAQLKQASMSPRKRAARSLRNNDKIPPKGKQWGDDLRLYALKLWRRGHRTGPGPATWTTASGTARLAGMSRGVECLLPAAEWRCDPHSAFWCPFAEGFAVSESSAYLISAVYEALQKNERKRLERRTAERLGRTWGAPEGDCRVALLLHQEKGSVPHWQRPGPPLKTAAQREAKLTPHAGAALTSASHRPSSASSRWGQSPCPPQPRPAHPHLGPRSASSRATPAGLSPSSSALLGE